MDAPNLTTHMDSRNGLFLEQQCSSLDGSRITSIRGSALLTFSIGSRIQRHSSACSPNRGYGPLCSPVLRINSCSYHGSVNLYATVYKFSLFSGNGNMGHHFQATPFAIDLLLIRRRLVKLVYNHRDCSIPVFLISGRPSSYGRPNVAP